MSDLVGHQNIGFLTTRLNYCFVFITGQGQTHADLQGMCDRMSGVSRESYTADQVLNSNIEMKSQQETNKGGLSEDLGGLSGIEMQSETSITALMTADNSIVKVEQERDTEHDETNITEEFIDKADKVTGTPSGPSALSSTSQVYTDIPGLKASKVEGNVMKVLDYPTFAKPNMAEQNAFHHVRAPRPKPNSNVSATTGIVGYETINMGIRCEICETIFTNQTMFETHVINGQCQWVCKFCKKAFIYSNYKTSNKGHRYSLFKGKLEQHKKECDCTCKLCGFSFGERNKLMRHMKLRHSNATQYTCDVCFITFRSETKLYTHKINKHTDESGIYRCLFCSKEYQILQSLSYHLKFNHLGHKKSEKACSVCGKMYDTYRIKNHENTHKAKDINCDQCPRVFSSYRDLKSHQRRHNKDYSHYCETCGKGFYSITPLQDHHRIHTGEKPFSCSLCQYSCNVKVNLDKHMKIHEKRSSSDQQ